MSNVSKQIYRKIEDLFPNLQDITPFTKVDLSEKGLPFINLVVFDATARAINFILSRYAQENGRTIANPCFEITANPQKKTANVVTYKDAHYFHTARAKPDDIGEIARFKANRFLYDLLKELEGSMPGVTRHR